MQYLDHLFKSVASIFIAASLVTGTQAIVSPLSFASSFGLPISTLPPSSSRSSPSKTTTSPSGNQTHANALRYVSLVGARQLGTGLTLALFVIRGQWDSVATVLSVIGFVVAGTDGWVLAGAGRATDARFHAIPGAGIAVLSTTWLFYR